MTELGDLRCPWDRETGVIAGPPGLVEPMRRTLNGTGSDDDDIRSEDFLGY